jgi:hypothetical protein
LRRQAAVLALLVVGPVVGLAGCGASDDPADLTTVEAAQSRGLEGEATTVLVPSGAIDATVGEPVDEVGGTDAADGESHEAPSGREWLPVQASLDTQGGAGVINTADTVFEAAVLELTAGDESFDLPAPYSVGDDGQLDDTAATTYVPVRSDEVDGWQVTVTYDGVGQRVGPDGRVDADAAAAYYDGTAGVGSEIDCSEPWQVADDVEVSIDCGVTPTTTPYLPGLGWAEDGQVFIRADVELVVSDATRAGRTPAYRDLVLTPSITGAEPVQPADGVGVQPPQVSRDTVVQSYFFTAPATADPRTLTLSLDIWGIPATSLVQLSASGAGSGAG